MKLIISVTKHDIKLGEGFEGEYDKCPIAQALIRQGYKNVYVDAAYISFSKDEKVYRFKSPRIVDLFIDDFDNSRLVNPIKIELSEEPTNE